MLNVALDRGVGSGKPPLTCDAGFNRSISYASPNKHSRRMDDPGYCLDFMDA
jgi:hypothetical protein